MRLYGVEMINALGLKGPEKAPSFLRERLGRNVDFFSFNGDDLEMAVEQVREKAKETFGDGCGVFIGGDHSISFPLFESFREMFSDAFLIVFDAHADCMEPMKEPTHEEFLRAIVEGGFDPKRIVIFGLRVIEKEEMDFLKKKGIKYFGVDFDLEAAMDFVSENIRGKDVYVSIDLDVFDQAFFSAVNYPEPLGFSSREFFYLFRRILRTRSVRAVDIVEYVPEKDKDLSGFRIIKKVISEIESAC